MRLEEMLDKPLRQLMPELQGRFTGSTYYLGIRTGRVPLDSWIYQEIVYETNPDFIVEVGVFQGGNTLMLAHLCDARGKGRVFGVDISLGLVDPLAKAHPRITWIEKNGPDAAPEIIEDVGAGRVLVIEDSAHSVPHTLNVLRAYAPLCKPGDYLVCEDTVCQGYGLDIHPSLDPTKAVETFLAEHPEFERDYSRESFVLTWNPGGFMRRKP